MGSCRSFEKRYAEAEPGFHNIPSSVVSHSYDYGYDCTGPAGCGQNEGAGGFEFNTQNIRNQAAQFNQQYYQGSSATNFSHGKKKRSAKPQFKQTYQVGSHSQGYEDLRSQIKGFEFNTQNIHNYATQVNPWYN